MQLDGGLHMGGCAAGLATSKLSIKKWMQDAPPRAGQGRKGGLRMRKERKEVENYEDVGLRITRSTKDRRLSNGMTNRAVLLLG
jgi:hypothetical protein